IDKNALPTGDGLSASLETANPSTRLQTIAGLSRERGATSILAHRRVGGTTRHSGGPRYREAPRARPSHSPRKSRMLRKGRFHVMPVPAQRDAEMPLEPS